MRMYTPYSSPGLGLTNTGASLSMEIIRVMYTSWRKNSVCLKVRRSLRLFRGKYISHRWSVSQIFEWGNVDLLKELCVILRKGAKMSSLKTRLNHCVKKTCIWTSKRWLFSSLQFQHEYVCFPARGTPALKLLGYHVDVQPPLY